ncbi:class I SAM-dependent methyltransferase [Methylobacterium sp. JK268]
MGLSPEAEGWLAGLAAGTVPPPVALMHLAAEAARPEAVEAALAEAAGRAGEPARGRVAAALALWRATPGAWETVRDVLGGIDHGASAEGADGVARLAAAFDRAARRSPEGSVALYALGSADLLRAATDEVVAQLAAWDLLPPDARIVDLGCGIGRFAASLAPHVAAVTGLDIAPAMIAASRARCAGHPNAVFHLGSGRDLAPVPTGGADLVLAVDSFPYLVQTGLAADHVREAARVLRPGGDLVILNYSYRGDAARDRREVGGLARAHGFRVLRDGVAPFRTWDGAAFHLQRMA